MVALFPGHIGKDSGAVGKTASGFHYVESAVNLAISHKVGMLLDQIGINNSTYMGSLEGRVEKSKGSTIGISIHADYIADKNISGYHIIHYPESLGGDILSCLIDESLEEYHLKRARKHHNRADIYILRKTAFPTILIETGFLSNEENCKALHDRKTQWRMAHAIVHGIVRYNKTGVHEL